MEGQTEKKATLKRVAFGNGVFVVGGQDGLLAVSDDGLQWKNNKTVAERGDVSSVIYTGKQFLASTKSKGLLVSDDGQQWKSAELEPSQKSPSKMVKAGDWIFGWSWPPYQVKKSRDGLQWEAVSNPQKYYVKDIVLGDLAGTGEPPALPQKKKKVKK